MGEQIFFSINDEDLLLLKADWHNAFAPYTSDEKSDELFEKVVKLYSQPHRAYHNLSHVKSLLDLGHEMKNFFVDYEAVYFAIWFHDAIYETNKNDNEEHSAHWANRVLNDCSIPQQTVSAVQEMILATKHHTAEKLSKDTLLFLDLDLSILGASQETYSAYSRAIRKEYAWVPDERFRTERAKILERFLQREIIYNTKEMLERFETQARKNIKGELNELKS